MDHRKRLAYAEKQLENFSNAIDAYFEGDALQLFKEPGKAEGDYVVSVHRTVLPPPEWELDVVQCLASMRSSLEYLAQALVLSHTPEPRKPKRIQFPIYTDPAKFDKEFDGLREASPEIMPIVRELQPFASIGSVNRHPLALLADLSNEAKHQRLLPTVAVADIWIEGRTEREGIQTIYRRPLTRENYRANMKVSRQPRRGAFTPIADGIVVSFELRFETGTAAERLVVSDVLWDILEHIQQRVFPALEPFLAQKDTALENGENPGAHA